ncbi:MAG: HAD-IIIA family hydrolase [Acidobacteriaceae bacterium]|nr:HAD-IIIA family hydrolase [Acidobacteriaceae bacterium]
MTPHNQRVLTDISDLLSLAAQWRNQHLSIGFTCGAFDLLHAGHADYLEKAKTVCDRLVVAVNSDESIRRYKNPHRPIIGQEHRMKLVAALRSVDAVMLMDDTRPTALIEALRPDVYIKGGDYQKQQLQSAPVVESYGGRCEIIPVEHEISSSSIIGRIEELSRYPSPEPPVASTGPVVFLDRDGTLIENVPFLRDPGRVRLLDGVGEGLRALQNGGFRLVIVTNQQGIGLGYFSYEDFVAVNSAILRQLATYGVKISKFYYCPHSLADECGCRKPGSMLIKRALKDLSAEPDQCFVIGDAKSDMEAAEDAGCTGILVNDKEMGSWMRTVPSFLQAAELILTLRREPGS